MDGYGCAISVQSLTLVIGGLHLMEVCCFVAKMTVSTFVVLCYGWLYYNCNCKFHKLLTPLPGTQFHQSTSACSCLNCEKVWSNLWALQPVWSFCHCLLLLYLIIFCICYFLSVFMFAFDISIWRCWLYYN